MIGLLVAWVLPSDDVAEVGHPAPDFTVPLIKGETFTLSEQLKADNRPVVLNLWASWCIPCRTETPDISGFAEANPDVKVIGVAVEDTERASRTFAEEFDPSYDLGLGDSEFEAAYPKFVLPVTYIIGANGVVEDLLIGIVTQEILEDITGS
ncbi:MAG: TlpA disulfide reductase family protein [Acidimicrobiia bacterium]